MPKSDLHHRQRVKNWALFLVLLALAMVFFWLTIIKMTPPVGREASAHNPGQITLRSCALA